jgi:hypothetical protein
MGCTSFGITVSTLPSRPPVFFASLLVGGTSRRRRDLKDTGKIKELM